MHVIITCKYEKDRMKNSRGKVATSILDAQGQVTLWSVVKSGRISISSKGFCMSSLPASLKSIRSKTAEKKWQHRFSHYKNEKLRSLNLNIKESIHKKESIWARLYIFG